MSLHISQKEVARVYNVTEESVSTYLKNSPHHRVSKSAYYYLADVIAWVPNRWGDKSAELLKASTDNEQLHVGYDGAPVARTFEITASRNPAWRKRVKEIQAKFLDGIDDLEGGEALSPYEDLLEVKVLLYSGITTYILSGDPTGLPTDWNKFVAGFSIVNGGLDPKEIELIWGAKP